MNDKQSYIVASGAVMLIILTVFLLPWRLERSGELRWGPFYRPPVSYTTTWEGPMLSTLYEYEEAELAYGVLLVELVAFGSLCGALYHALEKEED